MQLQIAISTLIAVLALPAAGFCEGGENGATPGGGGTDPVLSRLQALRLMENLPGGEGGRGNPADAVQDGYRELLDAHPRHPAVAEAYAGFLTRQGREDALARFLEQMAEEGVRTAGLAHMEGVQALDRGRTVEAAQAFRQAADLAPQWALPLFNLANVQFLFRKDIAQAGGGSESEVIEQALANYRKAVQLEPANIPLATAYAETYYGISPPQWNNALKAWEHVRSISPEDDTARVHLARILIELGEFDRAASHLKSVDTPRYQRSVRRLTEKIDAARRKK